MLPDIVRSYSPSDASRYCQELLTYRCFQILSGATHLQMLPNIVRSSHLECFQILSGATHLQMLPDIAMSYSPTDASRYCQELLTYRCFQILSGVTHLQMLPDIVRSSHLECFQILSGATHLQMLPDIAMSYSLLQLFFLLFL